MTDSACSRSGSNEALTRYLDDGTVEIDNNAAGRALRVVALGRNNYLFAGSNPGGERAAAMYSLLGTAKLNGINVSVLSWPCVHGLVLPR